MLARFASTPFQPNGLTSIGHKTPGLEQFDDLPRSEARGRDGAERCVDEPSGVGQFGRCSREANKGEVDQCKNGQCDDARRLGQRYQWEENGEGDDRGPDKDGGASGRLVLRIDDVMSPRPLSDAATSASDT